LRPRWARHLGDDIDAPADEAAPVHWRALPEMTDAPALPSGLKRLSDVVKAPPALARRLSMVGIVDKAEGARLQPSLKPGQRLVSTQKATCGAGTATPPQLMRQRQQRSGWPSATGWAHFRPKAPKPLPRRRKPALPSTRCAKQVKLAETAERDSRQAWREATAAVDM
jgi:chromosome segregation protein